MEVLSNFSEVLDTLLFDAGLDGKSFAKAIGMSESAVYSYLGKKKLPSVSACVRIAEFFGCSLDYLLGREPDRQFGTFLPCPPWRERFKFLLQYFKVTKYRLEAEVPLTHSDIYYWQSGRTAPNLTSVVRLADYFGCSADFILGRET